MADKVKKKRDFSKAILIAKVSVFWILVAGVVILVQQTDKAGGIFTADYLGVVACAAG